MNELKSKEQIICSNFGDCPFAFTDSSEYVQGLGCLPTPYDIVRLRTEFGLTWACHKDKTKPCLGAIKHLKQRNLPYKVINQDLVHELDDRLELLADN